MCYLYVHLRKYFLFNSSWKHMYLCLGGKVNSLNTATSRFVVKEMVQTAVIFMHITINNKAILYITINLHNYRKPHAQEYTTVEKLFYYTLFLSSLTCEQQNMHTICAYRFSEMAAFYMKFMILFHLPIVWQCISFHNSICIDNKDSFGWVWGWGNHP